MKFLLYSIIVLFFLSCAGQIAFIVLLILGILKGVVAFIPGIIVLAMLAAFILGVLIQPIEDLKHDDY